MKTYAALKRRHMFPKKGLSNNRLSFFGSVQRQRATIGQILRGQKTQALTNTNTYGQSVLYLNLPHGLYSKFCTPVGTDLKGVADFAFKKAGATLPAGVFGAGFTSPTVAYEPTELPTKPTKIKQGVRCSPEEVTPTLTTESRYVKPGTHNVPGMVLQVPADACGKKGKDIDVPLYAEVSKDISTLVKKGEEEHCDDFGYAFNKTVGKWGAEVNKLAKAGKTYGPAASEEKCRTLIEKALTKTLAERLQDFAALATKTDDRDKKGYHAFEIDWNATMTLDKACTKAILPVKKSKTNKIGQVKSKDIMK